MSEPVFARAALHYDWHHDFGEQVEFLRGLAEINRCKHPTAACQLDQSATNLRIIMGRVAKLIAALEKENADLKAEAAKVPPKERWLDDADISAADAASTRLDLDANGDPNPKDVPPTDAELAAKLKGSADDLKSSVDANQQPGAT